MLSFMELADYLVTGLALVGGVGIGRAMRPKPPEPIRPICSCRHGYGTHTHGGHCAGKFERHRNYKDVVDPCSCQRYDGPDPAIFGMTP